MATVCLHDVREIPYYRLGVGLYTLGEQSVVFDIRKLQEMALRKFSGNPG
jgi:hypothetical protein